MSFQQARAKLEWANKHIKKFDVIIASLPKAYSSSIELNPETGCESIKYDLTDREKIFTEYALMIGDVLHNLKSALDYTWAATIKEVAPAALDNFTRFPFRDSVDELKNTLIGRKIDTISPELFDLVVSEIQPYGGGNDSLWSIHRLNILDKHKLLIPIVEYASIADIEVEDERGNVKKGGTWGTPTKPPYFVNFERGIHVRDKGHLALSIDFGEDTPLPGMDVSSMFYPFSMTVLNTINVFEFSLRSFRS